MWDQILYLLLTSRISGERTPPLRPPFCSLWSGCNNIPLRRWLWPRQYRCKVPDTEELMHKWHLCRSWLIGTARLPTSLVSFRALGSIWSYSWFEMETQDHISALRSDIKGSWRPQAKPPRMLIDPPRSMGMWDLTQTMRNSNTCFWGLRNVDSDWTKEISQRLLDTRLRIFTEIGRTPELGLAPFQGAPHGLASHFSPLCFSRAKQSEVSRAWIPWVCVGPGTASVLPWEAT